MQPSEYQKLAARTETVQTKSLNRIGVPFPTGVLDPETVPIRVNHAIVGLAGEVGELASLFQKWIYYGKWDSKSKEDLRLAFMDELSDCMWYIALACNALHLDLGEVMAANIRKLQARYPQKYSDEQAAEENRNRQAETAALVGDQTQEPLQQDGHGFGHHPNAPT